jgi:hypothetical protein
VTENERPETRERPASTAGANLSRPGRDEGSVKLSLAWTLSGAGSVVLLAIIAILLIRYVEHPYAPTIGYVLLTTNTVFSMGLAIIIWVRVHRWLGLRAKKKAETKK